MPILVGIVFILYCIVFIGRCTCNYIQNGTSSTLKVEARLHPKRLYQPLYLEFRNSKDGGVGGRRCPPGGGENSFYPNSLGQFYPDKQDPRAKAKIGFGPLNLAMNTSSSVLTCSIICYMEDNISKPPLEEPSNILFANIHMLNNSAAK